ncbi:oxidation resistance protein 1 isoform X3 [Callithrix jacchus]|uniref:Oxidation resistance protein 1 n=1 Tax=Callithrix jacchus TaxID=9483 RepID=F7GT92_CALJA|nr:oxidation resistance protein 1 isoform X2 [Callithrix jacchus]XP_035133410.1 oxidation resistance protein 1 isoform X2 [Callithrix jacchus]XP_035133412.1 oxidation resistance protein 1 isoform X2 [Callithrix jacchus]XP_035133413.1 oxidation resistance protein 1 isoform X2 [Callithrix jacchus]XP_035133414.1 oxidation resistance protein 1 isoform X2 [Callithrix jacchus]
MSVSNISWLKKKSQSVDINAPGFNPLAGAGKQSPQASKPPAPKAPIIEEEQNNAANTQKHPSRRSELKRFYTIDTGQKKTLDKKDGRRMSFQKPKGTIEYTVESRDSLNSIALKFDTTPNELVQLNKLFSRAVVTGQVLYVPDPEYVSSVESSPSLSPISPLSPTSSEAEFDKTTNPDVHPKETTPSSTLTGIRPARVVSSTSEEEEAFTEKFLKINCKYITSGKGTVSGVLLVTPNNIMFDPHKTDPLVQENGCEEYGIMCPMEEVMSAAMYKEILDSKIKESLPIEIDQLSGRDFCHSKKMTGSNTQEIDSRIRDAGNDSASTAPRSTEESLSEDVFTESELSPIREELVSSDELRQDKSSGASSESVQTVNQTEVESLTVKSELTSTPGHLRSDTEHSTNEVGTLSHKTDLNNLEMAIKQGDQVADNFQGVSGPKEDSLSIKGNSDQDSFLHENSLHQVENKKENMPCGETTGFKQKQTLNKGKQGKVQNQNSETEVEELRKLWKTHTMQQTKQQRENIQQVSQKEVKHKITSADGHIESPAFLKEKRRHRLHKFLCLRVGKPMRKTFVSQASATMQQYAQRDKKHEYWFAVPQERTDHLYAFFIQWSPEIYAEDTGEYTREPGFIVVKKIEESETVEDSSNQAAAREWEVVSVAEYHRRIDALNTEELRTLCRRLQITTREDINSKQVAPVKADLESESFRPNLSDPSELLLPDQIEKLTKHLPPRTIGYPWTLVYGTGKHGTSLKTLYRTMTGLDTPVLMVIKDSDGQVFGALASEPFKVSDGFYGTGETFVFTFCPEFEVFKWTGDNMFFIKGDMDSLAFGGGGGEFALWLDGDLYHGRSHSCKTFGNRTLSKKEDFFIQDIEIWAFE